MDQETVGNVVLLAIVTLISVVQNGKESPSLREEQKGRFSLMVVWKSGLNNCVCVCACTHTFTLSLFACFYLNV